MVKGAWIMYRVSILEEFYEDLEILPGFYRIFFFFAMGLDFV